MKPTSTIADSLLFMADTSLHKSKDKDSVEARRPRITYVQCHQQAKGLYLLTLGAQAPSPAMKILDRGCAEPKQKLTTEARRREKISPLITQICSDQTLLLLTSDYSLFLTLYF